MGSKSLNILPKLIKTKHQGIYYKEVQQSTIDDHGKIKTKIVDKVYVVRYRDNGKERFVTMGKKSQGILETYCKAKRDEFVTLSKHNELPPQIKKRMKKQITTLDSIADDHYKYKSLHNRNNDHAKNRYNLHIKPILGSKDITEITLSDIEKLQQSKAKEYSPKHVNNIMGELSTIYTYAIKHGIVVASPMKQINKLKVDNKRERYLAKDEVKQLLETVKDDERLYTFMLLALNTGARVGAICKLKTENIDFEHKQINMLDEKNAETYPCYLQDQQLIEMLHKRIKTVGKHKAILDDGQSTDGLTDRIKHRSSKILNALFNDEDTATKNRVVVHTLRHTFASNLAINGVPILTIKKLMNHRDINQTLRYAKLAPDSGMDAVKGMYQ